MEFDLLLLYRTGFVRVLKQDFANHIANRIENAVALYTDIESEGSRIGNQFHHMTATVPGEHLICQSEIRLTGFSTFI